MAKPNKEMINAAAAVLERFNPGAWGPNFSCHDMAEQILSAALKHLPTEKEKVDGVV